VRTLIFQAILLFAFLPSGFSPVKLAVLACPPVFEYTCVSSTNTLMFMPLANIRDSAWKPMSYMAPSPPTTHSGLLPQPIWSHFIRTPMA
jgi:hypothetical protein